MEFPKLMWLPDGREVTVHGPTEQAEMEAEGASLTVARQDATVEVVGVEVVRQDEPEEEIVHDSGEDDAADKPKRRGRK